MPKTTVMTVKAMRKLLEEFEEDKLQDFEVWLSNDEEGNVFLPMFESIDLSVGIDPEQRRIVLFSSHC